VMGALMAVPILVCLKVVCDANERLAPVSQFLSGVRLR
jgi:predicted PurR-regulated permease PerM